MRLITKVISRVLHRASSSSREARPHTSRFLVRRTTSRTLPRHETVRSCRHELSISFWRTNSTSYTACPVNGQYQVRSLVSCRDGLNKYGVRASSAGYPGPLLTCSGLLGLWREGSRVQSSSDCLPLVPFVRPSNIQFQFPSSSIYSRLCPSFCLTLIFPPLSLTVLVCFVFLPLHPHSVAIVLPRIPSLISFAMFAHRCIGLLSLRPQRSRSVVMIGGRVDGGGGWGEGREGFTGAISCPLIFFSAWHGVSRLPLTLTEGEGRDGRWSSDQRK